MRLYAAFLTATMALAGSNGKAQVLPFGRFQGRDGRPGKGLKWEVNDANGPQIVAALNAIASKTPIVIDYEHQTFSAKDNGRPAPAGGWMRSFEFRSGEGVFAEVRWTAAAKASIDAEEYLYLSPVIQYDLDTGLIVGVVNAALTNHPAIVGMDSVQALTAQLNPPENDMDREALIKKLGLAATATDAEILAAIDAAQTRAKGVAGLTAALGLADSADGTAMLTAVTTLKGDHDKHKTTADGAAQTIVALQGQLATLQKASAGQAVEQLVADGEKAGKIIPATRDWALNLGRQDVAQLKAFLDTAPPIAQALGTPQTKPGQQGEGVAQLTADQSDVARRLGITPEAYAKAADDKQAA